MAWHVGRSPCLGHRCGPVWHLRFSALISVIRLCRPPKTTNTCLPLMRESWWCGSLVQRSHDPCVAVADWAFSMVHAPQPRKKEAWKTALVGGFRLLFSQRRPIRHERRTPHFVRFRAFVVRLTGPPCRAALLVWAIPGLFRFLGARLRMSFQSPLQVFWGACLTCFGDSTY